MDNFIYNNPTKIIFGKQTIPQISKELKNANINKVLMLAGSGSIKKNGVYQEFVNSMNSAGIEFVEFWGVQPNPVLKHSLEAIELIKKHNLSAIVAIGGGSVIDQAKSIAVGRYTDNLWNLFEHNETAKTAMPIFVILTISATGSEMNGGCVLTNEDEQKKWAFGSPLLYPKVSIIDPEKQATLPWNQTANGGIDAMAHIMENYFMATNQEVTISYDESLMRSIVLHIDNLQINSQDYNSRANFAWIATMALNGYAGIGIKSGDWSTHKLEHGVSALHPEVAHGTGLGILFPAWIEYMNKTINPPIFKRWAKQVWDCDSVESALVSMKAKFRQWNSPICLSEIGINETELPAIADNILLAGAIGMLKPLDKKDILSILKIAL